MDLSIRMAAGHAGIYITLPAETVRYYNANGTDLIYSLKKLELYVE